MDSPMNFIIRYRNMIALFKGNKNSKIEDMESVVYSKWPQLVGFRFKLSCNIADLGECFLDEDYEIESVVSICKEAGISRCDVHVQLEPNCRSQIQGLNRNSGENQAVLSCLVYNPNLTDAMEGIGQCSQSVGCKRMLSDEWKDMITHEGQVFVGGVREFRNALAKFAIENKFEYRTLKNEPSRVTAECRWREERNCEWRIHATEEKPSRAFVIRGFVPDHTCGVISTKEASKKLKARGITDLIADDIRNMPGITPRDVQAQVREKYGLNISYHVAWKAMEAGRDRIFGDHSKSFSCLPAYFAEAERTNPDSVFDLDINSDTNRFVRCFFAFGACNQGFKYCRPVLMVDGTFLKGRHRGILLSAVGKDGNEGLYPLAFAIVSEETNDNWRWFLERVNPMVDNQSELVIVSDRHHGIIEGVRNVFPDAKHGFCYKHLTANLKDKFKGETKTLRGKVVKQFADCAYAAMREDFNHLYAILEATGGTKFKSFISDLPRESWSNAYFPGRRYGQMTSNGCESWNSQIRQQRLLPITNFIDSIRILLMCQMNDRRTQSAAWNTVLCKGVDQKIRDLIEKGRTFVSRQSSDLVWEVFSSPVSVVDLGQKTCSCRAWQIAGLPSVHAVHIIFQKLNGAFQYIDECYHTRSYIGSYQHNISPFSNSYIETGGVVIEPPEHQVRRGRPKRKRVPSRGENIARKMRCGRCGNLGHHNKKSCNMAADRS